MENQEIRHRNLMLAYNASKASGARDQDFAARIGVSPSMLTQLKDGKVIGIKLARKIEGNMNKPKGWMDVPQWNVALEPKATSGPSVLDVQHTQDVVGLLAQALAATIPVAGWDFLDALEGRLGPLQKGTFPCDVAEALRAELPERRKKKTAPQSRGSAHH